MDRYQKPGILIGLFFLTFSLLGIQVVFTRLYSFVFTHSYVYFIISMGMAGLGIGSFLYYRYTNIIQKIFMAFIPLPFLIMAALFVLNYYSPGIMSSFALTGVFFSILGIIISHIYTATSISKTTLYFVDLTGAALGSIVSYFLMQSISVPNSLQVLLVLLALSIWLIYSLTASHTKSGQVVSILMLSAIGLSSFINIDSYIRIPETSHKEMKIFVDNGAKIVDSTWRAFGKVDMVSVGDDKRTVFVDGSAGTSMVKYSEPNKSNINMGEIFKNTPALALALPAIDIDSDDLALVIGSGAGVEVNSLLQFGFEKITAVEINPDFVKMTQKHGEYNGNIYNDHPKVNLVQTDGRQFVRNSDQKYKLMTISMPLIKSLRNYQNYSMAENYLFTTNAFKDYRNALADDGSLIIIAHHRLEVLRLFSNVLQSFQDQGMSEKEAMKHIAIIEISENSLVMVIKKLGFTIVEANTLHATFHLVPNQTTGVNYIPLVEQVSHKMTDEYNNIVEHYMFNNMFYKLSVGEIETSDLIQSSPLNIKPVNDNRPFFYYFEDGIPKSILNILIVGSILLLFIYFRDFTERGYAKKFIFIGLAFIMIEIETLQKFGLFWAQNTFALAVILAIILFATGLGSLFAKRFADNKSYLRKISILIPIVIIVSLILTHLILKNVESEKFLVKMGATILFVFPQFFLMGTVFPTLLSLVRNQSIPKMIALNSIATVVGSVIAIIIAMTLGFFQIAILGSLLYLPLASRQ